MGEKFELSATLTDGATSNTGWSDSHPNSDQSVHCVGRKKVAHAANPALMILAAISVLAYVALMAIFQAATNDRTPNSSVQEMQSFNAPVY